MQVHSLRPKDLPDAIATAKMTLLPRKQIISNSPLPSDGLNPAMADNFVGVHFTQEQILKHHPQFESVMKATGYFPDIGGTFHVINGKEGIIQTNAHVAGRLRILNNKELSNSDFLRKNQLMVVDGRIFTLGKAKLLYVGDCYVETYDFEYYPDCAIIQVDSLRNYPYEVNFDKRDKNEFYETGLGETCVLIGKPHKMGDGLLASVGRVLALDTSHPSERFFGESPNQSAHYEDCLEINSSAVCHGGNSGSSMSTVSATQVALLYRSWGKNGGLTGTHCVLKGSDLWNKARLENLIN